MLESSVAYALPTFQVLVRSRYPSVFTYLDSFYERASAVPPAIDVVLDVGLESDEPAAGSQPSATGTPRLVCLCTESPRIPPFLFQEARLLIRSLWVSALLKRSRVFNLHASAVDDGERVLVLAGDRRAGKTTLMLDALANHGFRTVTNDNLIVYESDGALWLTGLPTYIKVRTDVAHRFGALLNERARLCEHNELMWKQFCAMPRSFPFHGEAMLAQAGFSAGRQPLIPLAERRIYFACIGFAAGEPELSSGEHADHSALRYLRDQLKWSAFPDGGAEAFVHEFLAGARAYSFRHQGDVSALVAGSDD